MNQARGAGDSRNALSYHPLRGLNCCLSFDPGAYAPGFMLSPAPQAEQSSTLLCVIRVGLSALCCSSMPGFSLRSLGPGDE